ncbi:helix-turn-helix transcriptional regulator [Pseudomonas viridiflava]|uniref:helix-turn-helix domain-containing protein n=1 Tax=Pseudomonas viridiflava TaxID=33069 RepID=UPI002ECF08AD|nr:helix-turn-helix transcriptional regulator [Pseudomonas viridiflava]WKW32843.1 helix-turn-helix domain-containing protein [Pseudomonas viridiflava]
MNASALGKRIKTVRRDKGLTLQHLADSTGVHYTQISKMERGECKLLSKNLLKICDFLHITQADSHEPAGRENLVDRVQALIQSWPQSERLIRHFVEGIEMALEDGHMK